MALLTVLVHACATTPQKPAAPGDRDGAPPPGSVDISTIPDAVPRLEPRSRYGNPPSYEVFGKRYVVLDSSNNFVERGLASWYGTKFHSRRTSSGEPYDMYAMTAAHKHLPLPTYVRVTNLRNSRSIVVKVNDRGPFHEGRVIDLSYVAAAKLGVLEYGTAPVEVRALNPGHPEPKLGQAHTETPPPASAANPAGDLYLQVGAFSRRDNAENLRQRLAREALPGIHIAESTQGQVPIYRVHVGPLASVAEAERLAQDLLRHGIQAARVIIR